ncbi:uncharacterized protein GGS25DRAFT_257400 [Hypoxylon fragiforme]|uniref:uncharacterized protein n=1 Tax=Hypoxylon fragiforme TaxID=63214 RepID=UPI0020C60715|nr:uncharacterized protein GGS25DRAFT_257400 [Hypoxylon fragiforme]KAI2610358.1 hypothetical protein GGS25DRAFT_257400 [Hypoxylon fragiforme]
MPPKKRTAAEAVENPETSRSSRRRSNRIGSTGTKSNYFEGGKDDDNDSENTTDNLAKSTPRPRKAVKLQAASTPASSGRRKKAPLKKEESVDELQDDVDDDDDTDVFVDDGDDGSVVDEDDFASDDDESKSEATASPPPSASKRGRGRPAKQKEAPKKSGKAKSKTLDKPTVTSKAKTSTNSKPKAKAKVASEEPEVDDDDDDEDEDENRITFIPAIQLRDLDGVDYEDDQLHKNTILFLKDLKANNNRNWLRANDEEYRRAWKDWESFVETITEKIIEADETIPELPVKDVIFRIYRDIRFSKDQTPYKPHFAAAWSRTGRKGPYACYYVQMEPGHCMVGGGLWHPEGDSLARLRASIDERPRRIRRVLMNPVFCRTFLPGAKVGNEKSVLAAFAEANKGNALKTKPKGFHPEHADIALLKLRNYTVSTKLKDSDLTAPNAQEKIIKIISAMVPFVSAEIPIFPTKYKSNRHTPGTCQQLANMVDVRVCRSRS